MIIFLSVSLFKTHMSLYVFTLIIIAISMTLSVVFLMLTLDLALSNDRAINKIEVKKTIDDIINGTIPYKIINGINSITREG